MGFCRVCECLKHILPVGFKWGSVERRYRPVTHNRFEHSCGHIVEGDEVFVCRKCGPVPEAEVEVVRCSGDKKDV